MFVGKEVGVAVGIGVEVLGDATVGVSVGSTVVAVGGGGVGVEIVGVRVAATVGDGVRVGSTVWIAVGSGVGVAVDVGQGVRVAVSVGGGGLGTGVAVFVDVGGTIVGNFTLSGSDSSHPTVDNTKNDSPANIQTMRLSRKMLNLWDTIRCDDFVAYSPDNCRRSGCFSSLSQVRKVEVSVYDVRDGKHPGDLDPKRNLV